MPISSQPQSLRRVALGGLTALAIACTPTTGSLAAGENEEYFLQFHSFVPAQKSFKLPKLTRKVTWRGDMRKARKAWREGKYVKARKHLERAHRKGHMIAAWYLGHIYQQGRGVKKNEALAFKLYRDVALAYQPDMPIEKRMIFVDARVRVADVYREGSSAAKVQKDPNRALRLYSAASSHGHPGADYGLAVIYLKGLGIRKNPKRALRWLSIAAGKRYAPAEALLGELYWQGKYVPKDRARAVTWYLLARETANPVVHRHIFDRLEEMLLAIDDKQRSEALAIAGRWNKKIPAKTGFLPASD
ncbi:MAG: sel1 repeat family protein [Rhizobiales bacterium]|nr:sel1 repeat family protein [Hyphomicrobiales bacterium]